MCAVFSGGIYGIVGVAWEKPLLLLDLIVFALATITWTQHDAQQHGFTLWRFFVPLMVIFPGPLFVMPVYFVQSRGWASGLMAILLSVVFVAIQYAIGTAATYFAWTLYWSG